MSSDIPIAHEALGVIGILVLPIELQFEEVTIPTDEPPRSFLMRFDDACRNGISKYTDRIGDLCIC